MSNIIQAVFCSAKSIKTDPVWRIDRGMKLQISGLDLPDYYQVHFSNQPIREEAIPVLASSDVVEIPDQFFQDGDDVYAWVYVTPDEDVAYTIGMITIPVKARPDISGDEPTPAQENIIDSAIAALNENVGIAETSAQTAQEARDAAVDAVTLAESWAVGGTGTRTGEDTDNAKHYSEVAQQGAEEAGYAFFDIDDQTGEMMVTVTDNLAEDVSFAIDENNGILEVTVNG